MLQLRDFANAAEQACKTWRMVRLPGTIGIVQNSDSKPVDLTMKASFKYRGSTVFAFSW